MDIDIWNLKLTCLMVEQILEIRSTSAYFYMQRLKTRTGWRRYTVGDLMFGIFDITQPFYLGYFYQHLEAALLFNFIILQFFLINPFLFREAVEIEAKEKMKRSYKYKRIIKVGRLMENCWWSCWCAHKLYLINISKGLH